LIILFLVFFNRRKFPLLDLKLVIVSLGLIAGGIIGNLIDRLTSGQVTDFIDFSFWPAFNVADSGIVIGSIILCLAIILQYRDVRPSSDGEKT
jgi:lipoprotein signal peptidase